MKQERGTPPPEDRCRNADASALLASGEVWRDLLLATVDSIIERFDRNGDYPFLDTKIDAFSGRDLPLGTEAFAPVLFGKDTVYAWIQSRGVEALCGHARWIAGLDSLSERRKQQYLADIRRIVERVITTLEAVRRANGGSLFFWMTADGEPFEMDADGHRRTFRLDGRVCTDSDAFHVKAVAAAAEFLDDESLRAEALRYYSRWMHTLAEESIWLDQQAFDPKNPVRPVPGRHTHGPAMATIGICAAFAEQFTDAAYIEDGLNLVRNILERYVNLDGRFPDLQPYDFVEYLKDDGTPFPIHGEAVCDPGHGIEFVGLSLKLLNIVRNRDGLTGSQKAFIARCERCLPPLMKHLFEIAFNPAGGGIVKLWSLTRRRPFNSDMPWWSLPETMRAAAFCAGVAADPEERSASLAICRRASDAFLTGYINPRLKGFAYQTRNEKGEPVSVVPATPDLDPGYHTGLCVIDCFAALQDIGRLERERGGRFRKP